MKTLLTLACGLTLVGCAGTGGSTAGGTPAAVADLVNASGQRVGTAAFTEQAGTVRIVVEASGLAPGRHGIHVHAVGKCEPPAFTSAGGHHNPLARKHGLESAEGPHAGDLPNLVADAAGKVRYEAATSVTLRDGPTSVFDADGSALVIHEKEDDQKTDPTGNSGGRVACGVIVKKP